MAVEDSERTTEEWDKASFVLSSRYRMTAIRRLEEGPATPSVIAGDENVRITHISRSLQEMRERGLVDLLVSDDRKKGRVYGLTEAGRKTAEMVEEYH